MHDLTSSFHIFSTEISALDIGQGGLGDCYLLSAYASLANRNNGSLLKNMFVDIVNISCFQTTNLLNFCRTITPNTFTLRDGWSMGNRGMWLWMIGSLATKLRAPIHIFKTMETLGL